MNLFSFIMLFGGLSFFLYGMHVLSTGLEKMAGGKLQQILQKITSCRWKCLLLGAGITIAIQSSSAVTVMLVGLVNSGIMELGQTVGVLMGSNIGTTLTAWILSLSGVQSDNVFISLLKPENFSLVASMIGILMILGAKSQKKKDIGTVMVGFAILIFGMRLMGDSVEPLSGMPEFTSILTAFENPFLGVLVGTVFTGIIQSSAASVGILQIISMTDSLTYGVAIPIIMGQNIGTCVTAIISSFGVNKNAKRVAVIHMTFNIFGSVLCLILFFVAKTFFNLPLLSKAVDPFGIALSHTVFNVFTTVVLLPFGKWMERFAKVVIKDTNEKEQYSFIDERLLNTPSMAIYECNQVTLKMADIAKNTLLCAMSLTTMYDAKKEKIIEEQETKLDYYEDELGTYLVKLSGKQLSDSDSRQISKLLHTIGDFERIGDHAVGIMNSAKEINLKKAKFSEHAISELQMLESAIKEIISITIESYEKNDIELARKVEPLEQAIDRMIATIKNRHIIRLQEGRCTIEHGFMLSDLLNNYARVSDHCSNIAVATIEVEQNRFETHQYLQQVKYVGDEQFNEAFVDYCLKYDLK
ncbi:MAG TPA: Na/Pi cotransporter family protein [Lachnospiraceae bacterium]|nr:Na/Pi cotransporter family protein [Lachnospiraceae bacterium]